MPANGELAAERTLFERLDIQFSRCKSRVTSRNVETTTFGPYGAIIPEVEGTAHIVGRNEFLIDPDDPLRNGFILR